MHLCLYGGEVSVALFFDEFCVRLRFFFKDLNWKNVVGKMWVSKNIGKKNVAQF